MDRMFHGGDSVNGDDTGLLCGDCSDDLTTWAEWAAAVDDLPNPAERVPCSRCGQ